MSETSKAYMGRRACGCVVAFSTDNGPRREIKATLKRWMRDGLAVEVTTVGEARPQLVWDCPHPTPPAGKDEIQAEAERCLDAAAPHIESALLDRIEEAVKGELATVTEVDARQSAVSHGYRNGLKWTLMVLSQIREEGAA